MNREEIIRKAQEEFAERLNSELERIERMKEDSGIKDFTKLHDGVHRHAFVLCKAVHGFGV